MNYEEIDEEERKKRAGEVERALMEFNRLFVESERAAYRARKEAEKRRARENED